MTDNVSEERDPPYSLIWGNCLDIMKTLPAKSVNLVLCDPPYGTTQNKWDTILPFTEMWECINRILTSNGTVILMGAGLFSSQLSMSNSSDYKYRIIWVKSKATNFLNAKKQPLRKHEDILVFAKKRGVYNPQMQPGQPYNKGMRKDETTGSYGEFSPVVVSSQGSRYPTDVVYFKTAETEGSVVHPTQKPAALMEYLVRTYSNSQDTVLDFCMGSGSTGVACATAGRRFIGIDVDETYYTLAKERVRSAYEVWFNREFAGALHA